VKPPTAPRYETRRTAEFFAELQARARNWIPRWASGDVDGDFGLALLQIAARFSSEVAERLDQAGDKMIRGLFDWLAVRGKAARPARVPVVFKLNDAAKVAVPAIAPVALQASVGSASVGFETESDVRILPGRLDAVLGVAPDADAFYLPPPGLSDLSPADSVPVQWRLLSPVPADGDTLQLDPGLGLAQGMLLSISGQQYRISAPPNGNLIEIDPPLAGAALPAGSTVQKVTAFLPFTQARNAQEHVLYLGDPDLFNIEKKATIEVIGGQQLGDGVAWEYWGKLVPPPIVAGSPVDDPMWQQMQQYSGPLPPSGDAIALVKPQGSMEPTQVGDVRARWIRARKATVDASAPVELPGPLAVRINSLGSQNPAPLDPKPPAPQLLQVDVMVNTTAADTQDFYPLGRQPRLFDTLYIGCPEAFSKPNAKARIRFDLADGTFTALSAIDAGALGGVISGVDRAGALHLFSVNADGTLAPLRGGGPHQPPLSGTRLTSQDLRPVMWMQGAILCVAVLAGSDVWVWQEDGTGAWAAPLGAPLFNADPDSPVKSLVGFVDRISGKPLLLALRDGVVSWRDPAGVSWTRYETRVSGVAVTAAALAPVIDETTRAPSIAFLAVLTDGRIAGSVSVTAPLTAIAIGATVSSLVLPFGLFRRALMELDVIALANAQNQLVAWSSIGDRSAVVGLEPGFGPLVASSIDGHVENGSVAAYLPVQGGGSRDLLCWAPFDSSFGSVVFEIHGDPALPEPGGPPTLFGDWAYLACISQGDIVGAHLAGTRTALVAPNTSFVSAFATGDSSAATHPGDTVAVALPDGGSTTAKIAPASTAQGRGVYAPLSFFQLDAFIERDTQVISVPTFLTSSGVSPYIGRVPNPPPPPLPPPPAGSSYFQLDARDTATTQGDYLLVSDGTATGRDFVQVTAPVRNGIAVVTPRPTAPANTNGGYWTAASVSTAQIFPAQMFDATNNSWSIGALRFGDICFPTAVGSPPQPKRQGVAALAKDNATPPNPVWVALDTAWTVPPAPPAATTPFVVDSLVTDWTLLLGDTSSNPTLAWEYWNGSGWWRLDTKDTTNQLKTSGQVAFVVPEDLRATNWAGKTSHWVRARLTGGDYGQEKVVVITTPSPPPPGATQQVVTRSTDGIQPPYALAVWVRYSVDTGIVPTYVRTKDSGSGRDQSVANRTPGALVEAFTPLAVALQRLESQAAATGSPCPPDCSCNDSTAGLAADTAPPPPASGAAAATTSTPVTSSRAIFLGFSTPPSDAPVNVLLLVDQERDHDSLAPLRVDALVGDHFAPVVASDATRGLGESGVLSMSFSVAPVPTELFGATLSWVRLTPSRSDPATPWNPGLRGAYVNAVWASARETLTRELLGSSEGAPNLSVTLARPPALYDSLELRVNEPLGDEEIASLREQAGSDAVLTDVENLPGDWVLWSQVVDPLDEDSGARVYSLDEDSGVIKFGDGEHGRIPPVARDCIVAFVYQRTEVGNDPTTIPGNSVVARMPLNLVSPLETVESVVAADQAAGGAPPDPDDFVLRFGAARLRHRDRVISLGDLEDLAVGSSPQIAQARGFVRSDGTHLVVVMKGEEPRPGAAQARELTRMLLEMASPELNLPGSLQIDAPSLRTIRVDLALGVLGLEHVGGVEEAVKSRIAALFDPAAGGIDGSGWPLGAAPRGDDIAVVLQDTANLESISSVSFRAIADDRTEQAFDGVVQPDELIALAQEPVRFDFQVIEAVA
jgi:hypothetical protein